MTSSMCSRAWFVVVRLTASTTNFTQHHSTILAPAPQISGKYKHGRTGFSIDKLQMKETGGLVGEFSLANVAPGLVFTFKVWKGQSAFSSPLHMHHTKEDA